MPSTSPSTLSPGFKNTGGTRAKPTPDGVPVLMMSPGSSVSPADKLSIVVGMSKIISRVLPSCMTSPLTRQMRRTCWGSGSALLWTIHGPRGQNVSSDLPLNHWPCWRCSSRADADEFLLLFGALPGHIFFRFAGDLQRLGAGFDERLHARHERRIATF